MSVNDVADGLVSVTSVPVVGDAGPFGPSARRIITPAKSAPVGFVHDNATPLVVAVTATPLTGPGGVVVMLVSPETPTGVLESVVVPFPSWPWLLTPQAQTGGEAVAI